MYFLIGVCILVIFSLCVYLKIRSLLKRTGLYGIDLANIVSQAREEAQDTPKNLASMDKLYLEQIKKDFPSMNINELKRNAESVIIDLFNCIENKNTSNLKGKIKSFATNIINDNRNKEVKYDDLKIHNTVISSYKCDKKTATIYFSTAFQYYLDEDGKIEKIQDRVKLEYIYVIDEEKVDKNINLIGLHCPNCGSPITSLGEKSCRYCGGKVEEIISRTFICNDIVRY